MPRIASIVLTATAVVLSTCQAAGAPGTSNYRLRPGDVLEISIFQEPDLRTQARIQADGSVTLPLIESVPAARQTLPELRSRLADLYDKDFLVRPQISLQIISYAPRSVQVIGQVNHPGAVALPPESSMRLLEAIGFAGGFTRRADAARVTIRRTRSDGTQELIEKDVAELLSRPDTHDLELLDGDTILVGERWL